MAEQSPLHGVRPMTTETLVAPESPGYVHGIVSVKQYIGRRHTHFLLDVDNQITARRDGGIGGGCEDGYTLRQSTPNESKEDKSRLHGVGFVQRRGGSERQMTEPVGC